MTQISKGDTFADGQQVTGSRLNQLVDSSQLLVGAITDQSALASATVAADDQFLVSDTSTGLLKKTTANDILGSSLPVVASSVTAGSVVTSVVNAGANSDILVTPYDGANVTGKAFSSADGITATVTHTAHGLVAGMTVSITASNTAYSGQYVIVVPTVDTFAYSVYPTTTAASGTCSYIRKATKRVNGNHNVIGNTNIAGNETIGGNLRVLGTTTFSGTATVSTPTALTNTTQIANTAFVRADNNVKAWICFNSKPASIVVNASYNITSITDNAVGDFTLNFTTAISDVNYAVIASNSGGFGLSSGLKPVNFSYDTTPVLKSTTQARIVNGYTDAVSYDTVDAAYSILR